MARTKRRSKRKYYPIARYRRGEIIGHDGTRYVGALKRVAFKNIGTHYFKRTVSGTTLTHLYPVNGTGVQVTFKLSDLPNYTDFTGLFDQYMITKVVMNMFPASNVADSGTTNQIATLRVCSDPDGGPDTAETELAQKPHKDIYLNRNRSYVIRDLSILKEIYRSPTTTTYEPKKNTWIDMATADVPHYSLCMDWVYNPVTDPSIKVEYTYYFKCKGVR